MRLHIGLIGKHIAVRGVTACVRAAANAAVVTPVHMLFAELHGNEQLLRNRTVVADGQHDFNAVLICKRQVFLKIGHKAVVLVIPYFKLNDGTDGVEPGLLRERKLVFDLLEYFIMFILLPHGNSVYTV